MISEEYKQRARSLLYTGLQPAYKNHTRIVSTLARALRRIDDLVDADEEQSRLGKEDDE